MGSWSNIAGRYMRSWCNISAKNALSQSPALFFDTSVLFFDTECFLIPHSFDGWFWRNNKVKTVGTFWQQTVACSAKNDWGARTWEFVWSRLLPVVCVGTHFLYQDELYAKRFPSAIENRNMFPVNMLPFLANFQVILIWRFGLVVWKPGKSELCAK